MIFAIQRNKDDNNEKQNEAKIVHTKDVCLYKVCPERH